MAFLAYFAASRDFREFEGKVAGANGMFSVLIYHPDRVWIGVDRMRTFPLFYTYNVPAGSGDKSLLMVSDSVDQLLQRTGTWHMNSTAIAEFLATGYVTGKDTLAENVFQVQAGQVLELGQLKGDEDFQATEAVFYSSYRTGENSPPQTGTKAGDKDLDRLEGLSEALFGRLVRSLEGRTAVIALSGGYDSRFVAAMLKKKEYPGVICFSYGRGGNPDMLRAEEVAGKLGFPFIPVVYTEDLIKGFLEDEKFYAWVRFSSNQTSMFFMQEYFALKYLMENRLVPDDAVFIPGHSGDFFGGSQLIRHGLHPGDEDLGRTVRRIFDVKYAWHRPRGVFRKSMLERIRRQLEEPGETGGIRPYSIHEDWDLREKLAKFIVNSCNLYSWFGYEYRLPLYDYEFQDFFRDIPFGLKANKKLYDAFLKSRVFGDLGLNFDPELQPDEKTQRKARLKGKIKKSLPDFLRPVTLSREDPIFYYEITRTLRQDLQRRGILAKPAGNSYNSFLVRWYIEHLKERHAGYSRDTVPGN